MTNTVLANNVVRLPTAAPRKVNNHRFVAQSYAAKEARKAHPWPGEYRNPKAPPAAPARVSTAHIERNPALILAMCVFGAMDDRQRAVALAGVKLADCVQPSDATRNALLMIEDLMSVRRAATVIAAMEDR